MWARFTAEPKSATSNGSVRASCHWEHDAMQATPKRDGDQNQPDPDQRPRFRLRDGRDEILDCQRVPLWLTWVYRVGSGAQTEAEQVTGLHLEIEAS